MHDTNLLDMRKLRTIVLFMQHNRLKWEELGNSTI